MHLRVSSTGQVAAAVSWVVVSSAWQRMLRSCSLWVVPTAISLGLTQAVALCGDDGRGARCGVPGRVRAHIQRTDSLAAYPTA